ncbi:MAG: 30S ribosomal protein S16 [Planctomycetota bacterium]|nr:30S ribosomal protein S16 [Planctomycetota bacterium]
MAVRIRLKRLGRKNLAFYRICAFDSRTRRDGRAIEELGYYDPHVEEEEGKYVINKERAEYWLSVGAQPTSTCKDILLKTGVEVPGCSKKVKAVLTPEELQARRKAKEEKLRKREEAQVRKAIVQPKKLSKAELRAAKRAGG